MNDSFPHDAEGELLLTFMTLFDAFEQGLIKAGFTKTGRESRHARPDWEQFARHIEKRFHQESAPELEGAVGYLLCQPGKDELRQQRLENSYPWERSGPHSDVVWLSELIQEIGHKLFRSINFPGSSGCEIAQVMACYIVLDAWSRYEPQVERYVRLVQ